MSSGSAHICSLRWFLVGREGGGGRIICRGLVLTEILVLQKEGDRLEGGLEGLELGRGLGVKGKMNFFLSFFHVTDDS